MTTSTRRHNRRSRGRMRRTRPRQRHQNRQKWRTLARKRGIQRWSSLLGAKASRLAKTHGLRDFLGERCWRDFVHHANTGYRDAYIQAFLPANGVLQCQGPLEGGVCAQRFRVDLRQLASSDPNQRALASKRLELLHVDHTYDVQHIVDTWKSLSQRSPPRWDFGVDAFKLCAFLFGVSNHLTFRCAVPRLGHQCPCHHVARPHYHHTLNPIQLKP